MTVHQIPGAIWKIAELAARQHSEAIDLTIDGYDVVLTCETDTPIGYLTVEARIDPKNLCLHDVEIVNYDDLRSVVTVYHTDEFDFMDIHGSPGGLFWRLEEAFDDIDRELKNDSY